VSRSRTKFTSQLLIKVKMINSKGDVLDLETCAPIQKKLKKQW
jgi:hypothetical protein